MIGNYLRNRRMKQSKKSNELNEASIRSFLPPSDSYKRIKDILDNESNQEFKLEIEMHKIIYAFSGTDLVSSLQYMLKQSFIFSDHIHDKPENIEAATAARRYINEFREYNNEFRRIPNLFDDFALTMVDDFTLTMAVDFLFMQILPYCKAQNRRNRKSYPTSIAQLLKEK